MSLPSEGSIPQAAIGLKPLSEGYLRTNSMTCIDSKVTLFALVLAFGPSNQWGP